MPGPIKPITPSRPVRDPGKKPSDRDKKKSDFEKELEKDESAEKFPQLITTEVYAAAYDMRGFKKNQTGTYLTHAVLYEGPSKPFVALCRKVKNVMDDSVIWTKEPPDCPACLSKWKKLAAEHPEYLDNWKVYGESKMNLAQEVKSLTELDQATAEKEGLEPVYPKGHRWAERIFYDPRKGQYYDAGSDIYLDKDFDPRNPKGIQ